MGYPWESFPFELQIPSLNGALDSHQSPRTRASCLYSGGKAPPSPLQSPQFKVPQFLHLLTLVPPAL